MAPKPPTDTSGRALCRDAQPPTDASGHALCPEATTQEKTRRGFLASCLSLFLGGIAEKATAAEPGNEHGSLKTEGQILKTSLAQGEPPIEPLDSMIVWRRADHNNGRAMTHQILSLLHEEKGKNSYPWTIYSHLTTHHEVGDACGYYGRLTKEGPGWSTAIHAEVFNHGRAVALGLNIEMTNDYIGKEGTTVIGVNIQMLPSKLPAQYGLHVHGAGVCEKGIGVEGVGEVGLDIRGKYARGIDLNGLELRLGKDGFMSLDEHGEIQLRHRDGMIEFLKGGQRFAFLKTDRKDHEL